MSGVLFLVWLLGPLTIMVWATVRARRGGQNRAVRLVSGALLLLALSPLLYQLGSSFRANIDLLFPACLLTVFLVFLLFQRASVGSGLKIRA